jgi:hypothetical protein
MATVHGVVGIRLKDWLGIITSKLLYVSTSDATTLAQIATSVQAFCVILDPVTDAAGEGAHFTLEIASTGLKTGTSVNNELGNGALFTFGQVSSPYKYSDLVPAMAEAKITSGKVNLADADVAAYFGWLAANATQLQVESKAHLALTGFSSSQLVTRKHRKNETRVSYEPAP